MAVDTNEFCTTIQKKLMLQAVRDQNSLAPDQGTIAYLRSQENQNGFTFKADIDEGMGKVKTGRTRFLQRSTSAAYAAPINGNVCEPGTTKKYQFEPYTVDELFVSEKLTFSDNEMREFCEDKDDHIAEVLYGAMKAARSKLNLDIVTKILAEGYIGNFAGGIAGPKALPLFHTTENRINPVGEITINQDMTAAEIAGKKPRLIAANLFQSYAQMKAIQCCNTLGYDAGRLSEVQMFFLDTTYDSITGVPNNILALMPGALQLITLNYNRGKFAYISPTHTATTMADTLIPGLVYDLYTHKIECDEDENDDIVYNIQFKLRWGLWGYPDTFFAASDNLVGVKDVFHYVGECSDANVCTLAGQEPAPIALFSQEETNPDEITFDTTASEAQAPGAAIETYIWDFGGATGVKSGNAGETIVGVTGITGTYDAPVIDKTAADVGTEICLTVVDDNLNNSVKFCDELI